MPVMVWDSTEATWYSMEAKGNSTEIEVPPTEMEGKLTDTVLRSEFEAALGIWKHRLRSDAYLHQHIIPVSSRIHTLPAVSIRVGETDT